MQGRRHMKRLLGATVGTGLVATLGLSAVMAQDATPTPDAGTTNEATAEADQPPGPDFNDEAGDRAAWLDLVDRVNEAITAVQTDRDAVAGQTDTAGVDELLAKAVKLRDDGAAALESDDPSSAPLKLMAARQTAMAASTLLHAQLSDWGLPSQKASASRTLVAAHHQIQEAGDQAETSTDGDVAGFVTTAQSLYQQAYDLYNAGTYAQAARTADAAAQVSAVASLLTGGGFFTIAPMPGDHGWEGTFNIEIAPGSFGPFDIETGELPIEPIEAGGFSVSGFGPESDVIIGELGPNGLFGDGFAPAFGDFGLDDPFADTPYEVPAPTFD